MAMENLSVCLMAVGVLLAANAFFVAAFLIPIFIFGEARMGRKTGSFLLIAYATYVILRVLYDKNLRNVLIKPATPNQLTVSGQ